MKLFSMIVAGALAAGTLAAVPAEAQRYGDGYGYGRYHHWHRGDYRPVYRGGYYGHRGYYRHARVVCRVHRGRFGPVRRCF